MRPRPRHTYVVHGYLIDGNAYSFEVEAENEWHAMRMATLRYGKTKTTSAYKQTPPANEKSNSNTDQ